MLQFSLLTLLVGLQAKQRSAQLRQRIDELVELNKTLDDTIRDYREVV